MSKFNYEGFDEWLLLNLGTISKNYQAYIRSSVYDNASSVFKLLPFNLWARKEYREYVEIDKRGLGSCYKS